MHKTCKDVQTQLYAHTRRGLTHALYDCAHIAILAPLCQSPAQVCCWPLQLIAVSLCQSQAQGCCWPLQVASRLWQSSSAQVGYGQLQGRPRLIRLGNGVLCLLGKRQDSRRIRARQQTMVEAHEKERLRQPFTNLDNLPENK